MAERAIREKRKPRPTFSVSAEHTAILLHLQAFESVAGAQLPSCAAGEGMKGWKGKKEID